MKLTRVQEEACNLLSALASVGASLGHCPLTGSAEGKWSAAARSAAYAAVMKCHDDAYETVYECYAEAEALIRDGSVR